MRNTEMAYIFYMVVTIFSIGNFVSGQNFNPDPNCECIRYYNCFQNLTRANKYGQGIIDIRVGEETQCPDPLDVCCSISEVKDNRDTYVNPNKNLNEGCGYRNRNGIDFKISGGPNNIAQEGEFPWMIFISRTETVNGEVRKNYKCGGALIHRRVVLTAAHCVDSYNPSEIVVRAGEWDTSITKERLRHQERQVNTIIKHPQYDGSYLGYDFALLIMLEPFELAQNIGIMCLPEKDEVFDSKQCVVTGWGKNNMGVGGLFSSVLKKVELPIVPSNECQQILRQTVLSKVFELHPSFVCAGGVAGVDSCEGDGGSPLICPSKRDSNRYVQAGIVSWGIGCNNALPAAYANVALVRSWIDENFRKFNMEQTYNL